MPDAVIVFDREGRYLWLNPAAERLTRMPRSELVGRRRKEVFPLPENAFDRAFARVISGASETEVVPGEYQPWDLRTENRLVRIGKLIVVFSHDVSDVKR